MRVSVKCENTMFKKSWLKKINGNQNGLQKMAQNVFLIVVEKKNICTIV